LTVIRGFLQFVYKALNVPISARGILFSIMRRSLVLLALALLLALPVAATARENRKGPPEDGTLEIERGKGTIGLTVRGAVIARIRKGKLKLKVVESDDEDAVRVRGRRLKHRHLASGADLYTGRRIRIRIVDSRFRMRIEGVGVHLSAVGRGQVTLDGYDDAVDTGDYSLNGSEWEPIPYEKTVLKLAAPRR
jgi:hypothetical protein